MIHSGDPTKRCDTKISEIMDIPALRTVFRSETTVGGTPLKWNDQSQTTEQESDHRMPKPQRPILLGDAPPGYSLVKPAQNIKNESITTSCVVSPDLSNLLNSQNLNQLLGSLTEMNNGNEKPDEFSKQQLKRSPGQRPVLLADPPGNILNS